MRFVVIGGDAAGMSAASRAKRNAPDIDVVVLEQTHDVSYSACGIPYAIAVFPNAVILYVPFRQEGALLTPITSIALIDAPPTVSYLNPCGVPLTPHSI